MTAVQELLAGEVTEADWLQWVRDVARLHAWLTYHTRDSRGSEAGFPDLTLVRQSELIFAELKTERGRVTSAQRRWLAELEAAGAETHVWRPSDADAVAARLGRRRP